MKLKQPTVYEVKLFAGRFKVFPRKDIETFQNEDFPLAATGAFYFLNEKDAERFAEFANLHLDFAKASLAELHFTEKAFEEKKSGTKK